MNVLAPCACGRPEPVPGGICGVCFRTYTAFRRWLYSPAFDASRLKLS